MPEGVMEWIDGATGAGRIVRGGHRYSVALVDVEPDARVPGARVHFDVEHARPGVARNVRRRGGRRSRPQHHGAGSLSGARRPDSKGQPSADPFAHPLVDPEVHPSAVAAAWANHLIAGDAVAAGALFAPDAVLHTPGGDAEGAAATASLLAAWPGTGAPAARVVTTEDPDSGAIRITWPGWGPDRTAVVRVEHGEIVEAWLGDGPAAPPEAPAPSDVVTITAGSVSASATRYAVEKVRHVIAGVAGPVLFARVKLRFLADPAATRPALAEALLDANGRAVRVHTAAATMTEAIDQLAARLSRQLRDQPRWTRAREVRSAGSGEWRHGARPRPTTAWFERPPDERQLVRRKSIPGEPLSIDEAIEDLAMLDYDFYLFNELASGQDALLRRTSDGALELSFLHPEVIDTAVSVLPLTVDRQSPPTLTGAEPEEWLEVTGEPSVFYTDRTTGRGHVLYRRYDGHYGLLSL